MSIGKPAVLAGLALGALMLMGAGGGDMANGSFVPARQAAFALSGATFGAMKGAVDRGDDVKSQVRATKALASWAHNLPAMFPAGSDGAGTKALPTVWSDRAGFVRAATAYAEAADRLAALAAAGDKAGFAAQWGATRATCKSCHDGYHTPMQD